MTQHEIGPCAAVGASIEMVEQLIDDDGRRPRRVVAGIVSAVGEHHARLGGHQQIEKELPVVVAQIAIAVARFA